jgi:hypothetical protein
MKEVKPKVFSQTTEELNDHHDIFHLTNRNNTGDIGNRMTKHAVIPVHTLKKKDN